MNLKEKENQVKGTKMKENQVQEEENSGDWKEDCIGNGDEDGTFKLETNEWMIIL